MKGLLFLGFTLITLILAPSVSAQTATSSARPLPKREAVRTMITEKKTERIEKLSAIRRERIMSLSNKMVVRLEATIERIEKLIDRIEKRIIKIEAENGDINVAPIKLSLNEAKQKLALIKVHVTSLEESLSDMPEAEDPKVALEKIREVLKGIKDDLKDVHGMLVKLIGDIKGLRVGNNKND